MAKGRRDQNTTKARKENMNDQLSRALAQLQVAGQRIGQLHSQWKSYLSGISLVVIYLSFYQLRTRIKSCLTHLEHAKIHGYALMIPRIGMDSAALMADLILAILLCFFLRSCSNSVARFSHPLFLTAQVSAASTIVLYWTRMQAAEDDARLSCVEPSIWTDETRTLILEANDTIPFPCSVVFDVMVAMSLWFMNNQRQQHITNVSKVERLRTQLFTAKKSK